MKPIVSTGMDNLEKVAPLLRGRRIGLMTNPTGLDSRFRSTIDILHERFGLSALLGCEHGVRGDAQAGDHVENAIDPETGVMAYSVYGKTQRMTEEMLSAFDVFVFDIQEVGVRFYTYLYSLSYAMEACAGAGKAVIVLDRPNPLGGIKREGTILDRRFASFVGDYELPTRTGITMGEYALYVKDYLGLDLDLTVVPCQGLKRMMAFEETGLPFVAPSPNCQSLQTVQVYPGTCIFEGTNLSEGRGTTQPFELIGAPFVDAKELERRMAALRLPGVHFRRTSFTPMFSKHQGQVCHGVQLHVLCREDAQIVRAGLALCDAIREMHPEHFQYLTWDEGKTYSMDKLLGTDAYRVGGISGEALLADHQKALAAFHEKVKPFLLYA